MIWSDFGDIDLARHVFENTRILKRPTYGIVTGEHKVPYILVGESIKRVGHTFEARGKILVSPRMVWAPDFPTKTYEELFGDQDVPSNVMMRVFGFFSFRGEPVQIDSENLNSRELEMKLDQAQARILDELERKEDIETGVIASPDVRYFPVSIEKFIAAILKDEFGIDRNLHR